MIKHHESISTNKVSTGAGEGGFESLVGISVVVEKLGVPKKTVYKWCHEAHTSGFPYYRLGRWSKFRLSEIEQWMQKFKR
jgi:Prophage CP4-57 regulatory protein (AlpA).